LRRVIDPATSGRGGAEPYIYDWIIIVMSNNRVPPDPSRYLFISYLSFLFLLSEFEQSEGNEKEEGWREEEHTVKPPIGNVQHHLD